MTAAFILATIVLVGSMLAASWFFFRSASGRSETTSALRELLLSRAEGKLTAEEFERRQAALYASMLDASPRRASTTRWYILLVPVFVAATMAALYFSINAPQSASSLPATVAPLNGEGAPRNADTELQELAQQLGEKLGEGDKAAPGRQSANVMPDRPGGDMRDMAKRLADRLAREPNNGSGWELLARSYIELRRYSEANEAFAKAAKILPPDANLFADWADAYVLAHESKWDKQALDIVDRALSIDPKHLKALALAGRGAFGTGNFKQAVSYWTRVKSAAPAGSMESKEADVNLKEARSKLTQK